MSEELIHPEKITRRSFLNYVLGFGVVGWLGGLLYPVFSFLNPPKAPEVDVKNISLGKADEMANNSSKMFKFGSKPCILIKTSEGELRAFDATCTHLECTVQLKKEENLIWCACHNGKYDLYGKNVSGPPPRPLSALNIVVQKGEIFVTK